MDIKAMMHKGVEWVDADAPVVDVAKRMRDKDIGAIPVKDGGKLVGLITDRDIALRVVATAKDAAKVKARDVMSADVVTCHEHDSATDAVRVMETRKIRRLPVLDDDKQLVGMLSLGDVSHALARNMCGDVLKAVSAHHA
jgi:CBS domain-containing protein